MNFKEDRLTEHVLKYVEIDEKTGLPTGRSVSISGVEFQPLQYCDLVHQKLDKISIPLRWDNARVLETTIPEISLEECVGGCVTLESAFSSRTIGLIKGGWLPAGLALQQGMTVMPDRCTVTELIGRFCNGKRKDNANDDFLDFFVGHQIRINPLLYVLEGNQKRNPTPEEVYQQFKEVCAKVKMALPDADLVPTGEQGLKGVVGIINDTRPAMARKEDFLVRLASKLRNNVGASKVQEVWDWVLGVADECGVPRQSMVVLAALSAVSVPNGKSPAKRLLKLTEPNYSTELAYNALADLRSLEILMYLFALFPQERIMLCTGDKDLALFWAGIRASEFAWVKGQFRCKFSPVDAFLPRITEKMATCYFGVGNE